MSYYNKYIKYKNKYIINKYGGTYPSSSTLPPKSWLILSCGPTGAGKSN
jgi:hypothetical protein